MDLVSSAFEGADTASSVVKSRGSVIIASTWIVRLIILASCFVP
jgi:hypothetical protein